MFNKPIYHAVEKPELYASINVINSNKMENGKNIGNKN